MNDLELTNDNCPPARKENPSLFRPPSASQTLRQAIYAQLKANPETSITLRVLADRLHAKGSSVYSACKQLVKHGFAIRQMIRLPKPTKKNPEGYAMTVAVRFVQPWEGKKQSKW